MAESGSKRDLICVAALAGAHGVRGHARIRTFTEVPEAIADYGPLETEDGRFFEILEARPDKGGLIARVKGIATREEALALKGTRLYVERDRLPEPDEEEFYHADLIGLDVRDLSGERLGKIVAVYDFGAGDLLEIRLRDKGRVVMAPFTRETVPEIAIADGFVTLDPPEGFFDENEPETSGAEGEETD